MQRVLLVIALATVGALGHPTAVPQLAAQTGVPVKVGQARFNTVVDWQGGIRDGLLVSNNEDGELRLDEGRTHGVFTAGLTKADFAFNAVGAVWHAAVPSGTRLTFELRGGETPENLGDWQVLSASDARSQSDDGAFALESLLPFVAGRYLQARITFDTTVAQASPIVREMSLTYMDSTVGPAGSAGMPRVPTPFGPMTLTPAPAIILRDTWDSMPTKTIPRQRPHGVILHQIGTDDLGEPLSYLRALVSYDTQVLGWDDLPFHFIVDSAGIIYEGRVGGPTAAVTRLAGGDAAIHIALLGAAAPSSQAEAAVVRLLAWLGEAYGLSPLGQHSIVSGTPSATLRPNIAAHAEVAPEASDPSVQVRDLVGTLRQRADQATIRARWYFAEGNTHDFAERLSVFNPRAESANVRFTLLRQPGPSIIRDVTIPPGNRADLLVNDVLSDTTDAPAVIESNALVIAERFLDFGQDIAAGPGVTQASRVWYFAEGSTDSNTKTFLILFNPQSVEVAATITYMKGDGTTVEQPLRVPPQQRLVVAVADRLPGVGFGTRVIASQPIVAERTMIFQADASSTGGGIHTGAGVVTLSQRWYFAEGTTQAPFHMWVLVLNPNAQPTNAAVTFLTPDGTSLTRNYAIPPTTRLAINVNEVVPDLGVATTVRADRPVAVERAMYWGETPVGTVTAGATTPAFTWRFADGRTSGDFQEYLLLSNPNKNQARITVEFILSDGGKRSQDIVMPGSSRYTMAVHQLYPGQQALAATVRSTQPIVVERSLFPGSPQGTANRGGATSLGVSEVER